MLDHIIVSRSLLQSQKGLHTEYEGGGILKEEFMLYYNENSKQLLPNRTYGGPQYYGGISDHLPVYVTLKRTGD
jgi:hypothetical protein